MIYQYCPHCLTNMNLDTDFMYQNNMFEPESSGKINCPNCGELVVWRSFEMISHDFEVANEEN